LNNSPYRNYQIHPLAPLTVERICNLTPDHHRGGFAGTPFPTQPLASSGPEMAQHFIYQYNRDPRTREYASATDKTPVLKVGEHIQRRRRKWVVDNVTAIRRTTANGAEKRDTEYVINLTAA